MELLTLVNVLLALVPRAVMAVMHTTIIRASMTAYSTAVGPSSRFRKFTTLWVNLRIIRMSLCGDCVRLGAGRVPFVQRRLVWVTLSRCWAGRRRPQELVPTAAFSA